MLINVIYNNGKACTVQAEPGGSADTETTCATKGTVELVNGALILTTAVLSCVNGQWHGSKYVYCRENVTRSGHTFCGQSVDDGCTSWTEEKTDNCVGQYVLMSEAELEGAASVTIDGVLMYANEGGRLVSVMGGGAASSSGDAPVREKLYQTASRKAGGATPKTAAGLSEGVFSKGSSKSGVVSK